MKIYNKLVRDRIPEIIAREGKTVTFRILQGEELNMALAEKLVEEVNELLAAETDEEIVEEAADVLEVLRGICESRNISYRHVPIKNEDKYQRKGGFLMGYCLESVEE